MTKPLGSANFARHAVITEFFDALEAIVVSYRSVAADDQVRCYSDDAERITANVARHLSIAHAAGFRPPPQSCTN